MAMLVLSAIFGHLTDWIFETDFQKSAALCTTYHTNT